MPNRSNDQVINDFLQVGKFAFLFFGFAALITLFAYLSGQWLPRYDLEILELGTCPANIDYAPQSTFTTTTRGIYICGIAEGTTFRNVMLYIYSDNSVIVQQRVRLEPGQFFLAWPRRAESVGYQPGDFRVELRSERLVMTATTFVIVEP